MKAIIMAGGTGSRLWPASRDDTPKQFHAFVGQQTMLQQTYKRLSFLKPTDIFISTIAGYVPLIRKQLPKVPRSNIIIESAMRDTGPSICNAAFYLYTRGFAHETMVIIYADHLIKHEKTFRSSLQSAVHYAQKTNRFGVIGVKALYPNVNLGYIRIGKELEKDYTSSRENTVFELDSFVEKPNLEKAKQFLNSYRYFWNTGLYVGKVQMFLDRFKKHSPLIYKAIAVKKKYDAAPKISIDFALIEKLDSKSMFVIPADLGWNDIGNWSALYDEMAKDGAHNVTHGNVCAVDTHNTLIIAPEKKLIATYGLQNLVIIDTPDALLVLPKDRSGDVKKIVEELKKKGIKRY